jgi:hypothetical protein
VPFLWHAVADNTAIFDKKEANIASFFVPFLNRDEYIFRRNNIIPIDINNRSF